MAESLSFSVVHSYDTRKAGITVDVLLRLGEKEIEATTNYEGKLFLSDYNTP